MSNDTISGTAGADSIFGMAGDDQLSGGDGNDTIFGDFVGDPVSPRPSPFAGSTVTGGVDADFGSPTASSTGGTTSYSFVDPGAGNGFRYDVYYIEPNGDLTAYTSVVTGRGDQTVNNLPDDASFAIVKFSLTSGEILEVTSLTAASNTYMPDFTALDSFDDVIDGGAGNDVIQGDQGDDWVSGGSGNDQVSGGTGSDTIYGLSGSDTLNGGDGDDTIFSDGLDGAIAARPGPFAGSTITGGTDAGFGSAAASSTGGTTSYTFVDPNGVGGDRYDVYYIEPNGDLTAYTSLVPGRGDRTVNNLPDDANFLIVDFATGEYLDVASLSSTGNSYTLTSATTVASDDVVDGGAGNDVIDSGQGDDLILSGSGADQASAGSGSDTIFGGTGSDTLNGDDGNDAIYGDTFGDPIETRPSPFVGSTITGGVDAGFGSSTASSTGGTTSYSFVDPGTGNGFRYDVYYVEPNGDLTAYTSVVTGRGDQTVNNLPDEANFIIVNFSTGELVDLTSLSSAGNTYTLSAGDADDVIDGGAGRDTIDGDYGDDSISGGAGNDQILGGTGNDTIDGGANADVIDGGAGNDQLLGGDGNDQILGGAGNDTVDGGANADVIDGGAGNDQLLGGDGNDQLLGGTGRDTLSGDAGDDLVNAGDGNDQASGGIGNDTIYGLSGRDTLNGDDGNDVIYGDAFGDPIETRPNPFVGSTITGGVDDGFGSPTASSTGGTTSYTFVDPNGVGGDRYDVYYVQPNGDLTAYTSLVPGRGNQTVNNLPDDANFLIVDFSTGELVDLASLSSAGNTYTLNSGAAGDSDDVIDGGAGDDTIDGNQGDDTITGGTGSDQISGGDGDDSINGGAGTDSITGDAGNDTITIGGGDTASGGDDRDTFIITADDFADGDTITIDGGSGSGAAGDIDDYDVIRWGADLTLVQNSLSETVDETGVPTTDNNGNAASSQSTTGSFQLQDASGNVYTVNFSEIEAVVCFVRGTRIKTNTGETPVEELRAGDMVLTKHAGYRPIRWIKGRVLPVAQLKKNPKLYPIRISKGALGENHPERDLYVSPQHRILLNSKIVMRMFGHAEILVAAKKLLGLEGVDYVTDLDEVEYFHFLLDEHQIVYSNGAETESLYTGPEALKAVGVEGREEILSIFPELASAQTAVPPVCYIPPGRKLRKLVERHQRNGRAVRL